jgi:ubiquinone/menaquinone biosynthesis C-methylase UbiE
VSTSSPAPSATSTSGILSSSSGPGPGRTTELLIDLAPRLTALEVDDRAVRNLRERLTDPRLTVVQGDATEMPFPDGSFSAAVCLTMLHHVASVAAQDQVFAEAHRVLRPDGVFVGSDGLVTPRFRVIHLFDTLNAVDPQTLPDRLRAVGFVDVAVTTDTVRLSFRARRS